MATDDSKNRVGFVSHVINRKDLKPGDHIYCHRLGYSHHGIFIDKEGTEVINVSGPPGKGKARASDCIVRSVTLDEFLAGAQLRLVAYGAKPIIKMIKHGGTTHTTPSNPADKVIETAEKYLDKPEKFGEYNLLFNNCETFAYYCKTGKKLMWSEQVLPNKTNALPQRTELHPPPPPHQEVFVDLKIANVDVGNVIKRL